MKIQAIVLILEREAPSFVINSGCFIDKNTVPINTIMYRGITFKKCFKERAEHNRMAQNTN